MNKLSKYFWDSEAVDQHAGHYCIIGSVFDWAQGSDAAYILNVAGQPS